MLIQIPKQKADFLRLVGYLVVQLKSFDLTSAALPCLVRAWRDMDSHIRQTGLKLVQGLIQSGTPLPPSTTLVEEMASLMIHPEFPDKAVLEELMQSRLLAPPLR